MSGNPAVLISDELIHLLEDRAICRATFQDLTGTLYPWDVDLRIFQNLRGKLFRIEKSLRAANPTQEITCVIAGKGAYWLPRNGVEEFFEGLQKPLKKLRIEGPVPVWKMTSSEIFGSHLSNLRQLILSTAHDIVLMDFLQESMGGNQDYIRREFENNELSVRGLLDAIQNQATNVQFALNEDIVMIERCRITLDMLEKQVTSESDLGYSVKELAQVMEVLDRRLRKEIPTYQKRLGSVVNQVKEHLRGGECTQLVRSSRWEMAYAIIGSAPFGFRGQAKGVALEREGVKTVVSCREEELGKSEEGLKALEVSKQVDEKIGKKEEPVVVESAPTAPVESAKNEEKSHFRRMAYTSRTRR